MTHPSVKALESVIKRVRDILRKGDGITDMDSMAHCVLFTAARMLNTTTAATLKVQCTWDSVINNVLAKDITAADKAFKDILEMLDATFNTSEFTWKLKVQDDFEKIVRLFNEIDIHEVAKHTDVLGFIYEQHLSTGAGAGRDLGKFYTDRQITRYLTELLGSDISGNRPDSMCDATMGTGGFILSYIDYVTQKCKNVKWDDYDLAGGDIDDKVAAIARLNVFLRTGKLFPMIRKRNTLKNDIGDSSDKRRTFKRLLMNIPFGVKGLTLADDCCARVKDIVKAGTKSEPLFMALTYQLLAEGGKAAVIVPDGVLVNCSKQHDTTRKYLLDNFKVLRIIKMRGKFFMNTGIQPSVIVFERSGKTDAVEFWDVEKKESGELVETCMLTVPREKFDASCSFDMRRYQEVNAVANPAGFPMVKLSDVCKVSFGDRITVKDNAGTIYPVYGSGGDTFKTDKFNRTGKTCKVGRFAISEVNMVMLVDGPYWLMDSGFTVESKKPETMITEYLWYCLLMDKKRLSTISTGSCQKNIEMEGFYKIEYLCPPLETQQEIVATLDRIYAPGTTELAETLKLTDKAMDLVLAGATAQGGASLEPIVEAQRLMRKSTQMVADVKTQMIADVKAQMVAVVKASSMRSTSVIRTLNDVCSVSFGERITQKNDRGTIYPVYGGGEANFHTDRFNREGKTCKVARFAVSEKSMVLMINEKYWLMDSGFTVTSKAKDTVYDEFLWWILWANQKEISECSTGSCQKNIAMDMFYKLEFGFPSIEVQMQTLQRLNALQTQLTSLENLSKQAEDNARFIMDSYLNTA
jgi:restriction endonuclease S subunit